MTAFLNIVLDILILAIIALTVINSSKRGFVRTLIELIGFIAVLAICVPLAGSLANTVYNTAVRPAVVRSVEDTLGSYSEDKSSSVIDDVFDAMPGFVEKSVSISRDDIKKKIDTELANGASAAASVVTDYVAKPIVVGAVTVVCAVIIFAVGIFLVHILAKMANRVFSLPVIGGANRLLGGVIGLPKGIVFALLFVWIAGLVIKLNPDGFLGFTTESVKNTYLFSFMNGMNPFI